jgi:hypothetical protein
MPTNLFLLAKYRFILVLFLLIFTIISCTKAPNLYTVKLNQSLLNDESYLHFILDYWEKNGSGLNLDFDYETYVNNREPFETTYHQEDNLNVHRVNLRSADVDTGRSKFRIGLIDMNMDGTFNQIGVDRIILSKYEKDTVFLTANSRQNVPIEKSTVFQIDRDYYEVTFFATNGSKIKFRKLPTAEWDRPIVGMTTTLPRYMVKNDDDEEIGIWKLKEKDKPLIILNWNVVEQKVVPEIQDLNRVYDKIKDQFSVIGVNYWNKRKDFKIFEQMNAVEFPTYHIDDRYYCYLVPCSSYRNLIAIYETDLHLIEDGITLELFFERMQSEEIQNIIK